MRDIHPERKPMLVIGQEQPYAEDIESGQADMLIIGERRPRAEDRPEVEMRLVNGIARLAINGPVEVVRRMHEISGTKVNVDDERLFSRRETDLRKFDDPKETVWDLHAQASPVDIVASAKMPYSYQDYQNTRNRRDHDEAEAIKSVLKEADSTLWLQGRKKLEARYDILGGDALDATHQRFYELNKDELHANALVDATSKGVKINTPRGVTVPVVKKENVNRFKPRAS